MAEELVQVGDVELCYEVLGAAGDPTVLLVMGLGLQLVWWRDDLVDLLVGRGLRVVRFDNRDVGRSTHLSHLAGGVTTLGLLTRRAQPAYSLADMADDAAGLASHVAPDGVHVVGVSLGALVAQELAIRHPDTVHSLTSVMGRPGDRRTGRRSPRMVQEFLRPAPRSGDPTDAMVATFRRIGSAGRTAEDDEDVRVVTRRSVARETGDGGNRQLAAVMSERDRTADLHALSCPTLVVHGSRDRVIAPSGGRATAAAVPGAELLEVDGMGHDLPRWVWPQLVDGIERTVRRASPQR